MNDRQTRAAAFAALIEVLRSPNITEVSIAVYAEALREVPTTLLLLAVERAIRTRTFMPTPAEFLADAEACRQGLLKDHPFRPCEDCVDSPGWRSLQAADGVQRVIRCDCYGEYLATLTALGAGHMPLRLPVRAGASCD